MQKKDLSKIKWGEIYTCDLGKMKGSVQCGVRPILVVQTNKLNGSSPTVVVAVITTVRKREDIASHIPLETDCGLNEPSMVMLEQIRTIDKAEELISFIGRIEDGETIAKIKDGIRYQFQLMRKRKPIRTGYILSLCPKCRAEFFSVPENILRRVDPLQVEKEPCDKCQVGYGYDYLITKRTKRPNNGGGGLDV